MADGQPVKPWRQIEWEQLPNKPIVISVPPSAPVTQPVTAPTEAVIVPVPTLLPDQKPPWYTVVLGYRTYISLIVSTILKVLATRGVLGLTASSHTDDVVNLIFLLLSFVADASIAWFKYRSVKPGKGADPALVVQALVKNMKDDAAQLAAAVLKASEVLNKAQAAQVQGIANKVITITKG